ncbi:MAG: hypothetical protein ACYC6Y_28530, partial [Thermoguttaceae bacterium]
MSAVRRTRGTGSRRAGRPAIVAVVVLLVIAVALAASYSAMRAQSVALQVRQNAVLGASARQAALTGLTAGFRQMHSAAWTGTGTTFARTLGANEGFEVQFVAGDDALVSSDPDYAELPYRVTLVATGAASDPADSRRTSRHVVRAVARLIPRALPAEPSDWAAMQACTFYQTKLRDAILDIPCRIEGPVRLQGKLALGRHYPDDDDAWSWYFYHLNLMRWNGYNDYRPLTGRVEYDYSRQDWSVHTILTSYMSVATSHVPSTAANSDWSSPAPPDAYRLFPGGPQYSVPTLSGTVSNRTLDPSTATNPLGFYSAASGLVMGSN